MHPFRVAVGVVAATLTLTGWSSSGEVLAATPDPSPTVPELRSTQDVAALVERTADDDGTRIAVLRDHDGGTTAAGLDVDTVQVDPAIAGEVTRQLRSVPGVLAAEPDTRVRAAQDQYRPQQYSTDRVRANLVSDLVTGNGTTVAVVDSGVQGDHPDLTPLLPGGRQRVLSGTTFLTPDGAGPDLRGAPGNVDPNGHGTHVAGIIAAARGNGIGVEGIAPNAQILPVRALDSSGLGWASDVAEAILWAHRQGADVVNLSLAGPSQSAAISAAIDSVTTDTSRGKAPTIVVAAAGNSGGNYSEMWPAAHPRVIAVASTDSADQVAASSSRGGWVDVAAPGVSILSTCTGSTYCYKSGTSMAAPLVAGVAALLREQAPQRTGGDVAGTLQGTALDIDRLGRDDASGWGRIDVAASVDPGRFPKVPRPVRLPTGAFDELIVNGRGITVRGRADDSDGPPLVRVWSTVDGRTTMRDVWASGGSFALAWMNDPGTHTVCISALDTPTFQAVSLGCREAVVK